MDDIDLINCILKEIKAGYISYGCLHNNNDEGLKLISEALEKELPKEPYRRYMSVSGKVSMFLACPRCKSMVERSNYYVERCNCGQKLKVYKGDFK